MALTPYVVGQWVRGQKFYGRAELIADILDGNRNCLWLLGTRRIGKTSILKQVEMITTAEQPQRYFPLFWDFQGCDDSDDFGDSFSEALLDAEERLQDLDIDPEGLESDDLFRSVGRLRRELNHRGVTLLLLCDEVEELVGVHGSQPRFLSRLRRMMQSPEGVRTVLASKIKLWDLAAQDSSTSPFLHGFTPPLFVLGLEPSSARALVNQEQLPPVSRPHLEAEVVEEIRLKCNNHPYLLQLLAERTVELGDLDQAVEVIAADRMVSHFFAVDFEMLNHEEREVVRLVGGEDAVTTDAILDRLSLGSASVSGALQRLEHLGIVHRTPDRGWQLLNFFFRRWFSEMELTGPEPAEASGSHVPTVHALDDISTMSPPKVVDGRYRLQKLLGRGATGAVFRAHDALLESEIAIKILKQGYCEDPDALARLRREVLLARDLTHPHVLTIYHLGEDQGLHYVTMRYIAGHDLAAELKNRGAFTIQRALEIGAKLASALAEAHGKDVLHRDIKPSNVLMDASGEPYVTDFGLARHMAGPAVTRDGIFVGTPAYASPEQILGRALDARTDLYSLGVVIYELVSGRRPFTATYADQVIAMHLEDRPAPPTDHRPDLPASLSNLILSCLEKKLEDRIPSALELESSLRDHLR